jgi:uncharacterized membrane protein
VQTILDYPLFVLFPIALATMLGATWLGGRYATRRAVTSDQREEFNVVQTATLTLLGLIIGFTFSMAVSRYDLRKILEEEEANAIGTEYLRADLLPEADAAKVRALLKEYTGLRVRFFSIREGAELAQVNDRTAKLQADLWAAVRAPALAQPNPITALAVSGMNDVINAQGYTQAAWWNRIPHAAWLLMAAIGFCGTFLVGLGAHTPGAQGRVRAVLPIVLAIAFFLIADIDAPRGGLIRVAPQNLISLVDSLR